MQESRCIAVGKHFPGHGDTDKDSHLTLPVIRYDMKRLERVELVPFKKAIGAGVDGIMTAHIAYPAILGNNEPATVSKKFLTGILRDEIGFRGLVITDDMEMHAISRRQEMGEAAVRSILAGADIVLISSQEGSIPAIFNAIKKAVRREEDYPRSGSTIRCAGYWRRKSGTASWRLDGGQAGTGGVRLSLTRTARRSPTRTEVNAGLSRGGILYFGGRTCCGPPKGDPRYSSPRTASCAKSCRGCRETVLVGEPGRAGRFTPKKGKEGGLLSSDRQAGPRVSRSAAPRSARRPAWTWLC